jgi:hypothetical protein
MLLPTPFSISISISISIMSHNSLVTTHRLHIFRIHIYTGRRVRIWQAGRQDGRWPSREGEARGRVGRVRYLVDTHGRTHINNLLPMPVSMSVRYPMMVLQTSRELGFLNSILDPEGLWACHLMMMVMISISDCKRRGRGTWQMHEAIEESQSE